MLEPLRRSQVLRVATLAALLAAACPAPPARADGPAPATAAAADPLDTARDRIKSGDYDGAIAVLKPVLDQGDAARLREAYLLAVKTYVFLASDADLKPQGREAALLYRKAARELVARCLAVPALRRTRPEPESDYPPDMVRMFAEVRAATLGGFAITALDPPGAVVRFDGDSLGVLPDTTLLGDVDVEPGRHTVAIRAPGRRDLVEDVTIAPGARLERAFTLPKRRGAWWYATRAGAAVGVTTLGLALRGKKSTPAATPLPEAPPPPSE